MSTVENKAPVRRLYDAINRHDLDAMATLCIPDHVRHFPGPPEPVRGPEGVKAFTAQVLAAFPVSRFTLEQVIAESDLVANHFSFVGTHKGEFMGLPSTDKTVSITANDLYSFAGDKIAEEWASPDLLGMLQQLGALPAPGHAG